MPFPFISFAKSLLPLAAFSTGAVLFLLSRVVSEEPKSLYRTNIALQILIAILFGLGLVLATSKHHFSHSHPIDLLIHKGRVHFDEYVAQASASKTLEDAVFEYRRRYQQHPPP